MTWSEPWLRDPEGPPNYRPPQDILPVLWRFRWLIIGITLAMALAAYGLSHLQPVRYTATAQMILSDPRNAGVFRDQTQIIIDPVRYVRTQAELASSTPALARTSEIIGGRLGVEQLEGRVSTRASRDLDLVTIVATDRTAAGAQEVANAVAQAYQDLVRDEVQQNANFAITELASAKEALEVRITEVEAEMARNPGNASLQAERDAAVAEAISLERRINQLSVDAALFGSGVQLFEPAALPRSRTQPLPVRNAALGGMLGLLAAGAYAWWLGDRRRVVASRHDPAPILGAPLLGVIPDLGAVGATTKLPTVAEPQSVAAEAYHFVASSLEHALDEESVRLIVVTSPNPEDGKTTTAYNLAVALAMTGRSVLLVDADERQRGLSRWNRLEGEKGLTDLGDGLTIQDARRWFKGKESKLSLSLIPAGTEVDVGAGYFRSSRFRQTMTDLREAADVVILDTAPLLAVADTLSVASRADGIVLAITQGTAHQAIEDTRDRLAMIGTPLIGYVFNRDRSKGKRYGYGYGYGYGHRDEAKAR